MERRKLGASDLQRMHLPEAFWRARLGEVHPGARGVLSRYLRDLREMLKKGIGFQIYGGPGVGKTSVAALVLKEARSWGYSCYFATPWEITEAMRARIDFEEGVPVLQRCLQVDVLALDNVQPDALGLHYFSTAAFQDLVRERASRKRATVITFGLDPQALKRQSPGLVSLAHESLLSITLAGPDRRVAKARELAALVTKA